MKFYNLYYQNIRLNKQPITGDELQKIKSARSVSKVDYKTKKLIQIPFSSIKTVECIII